MLHDTFTGERKEPVKEQEDASIPFDPLKRYLSEISRHPVLSRDEELEVAERAHRYKDSHAAHRLVTSNLRLVVKIALQYNSTYLNILDLIQEGNVGLIHAVKKYNPYKGTRFSTYSSFWIKAYILKYIIDSWSMVKVGKTQSQRRLFYGLKKEKKKLEAIGVFPTPQLLAEALQVRVVDVEEMEQRLTYTDISLEQPLYDEGEESFMDTLQADDNVEDVVAANEKKEILERKISEFKKMLNGRELFIFERRIILEEPLTLEEIGQYFTVSRERVRQLEKGVLKKFNERFELEFRNLDL